MEIKKIELKDVALIRDPAHPLFDKRVVSRVLDPGVTATYQSQGQLQPILVASRENLARLGVTIDGPFTPIFGTGRRQYCEAAGIPTIDCVVREISSLQEFMFLKVTENMHRDEETLDDAIDKVRLAADSGLFSLEDIANLTRKPASTVRTLLRLSDDQAVAPEVRQMIRDEVLDAGSAAQIVTVPVEQQKEIVKEIEKMQVEALTKGESKRGDSVKLKNNKKGELIAKPTQDGVQEAKAKALNRPVPATAKKALIDEALVSSKLTAVALMRRLDDADESFIAGYEAALASLLNQVPALPEGAKYASTFTLLFPAKTEVK